MADSVQKPGGEETPVMQSSAIRILRPRVGKDGEWIEGETVAPVRMLSQCVSTPGRLLFSWTWEESWSDVIQGLPINFYF